MLTYLSLRCRFETPLTAVVVSWPQQIQILHPDVKKKGIIAKGIADAPEADVAGWIASFTEWTQRLVTAAKETMAENQAP